MGYLKMTSYNKSLQLLICHCHSRSERDCGEFADSLLRENFGLGSPGGNRLCNDLRNICWGSDISEVLCKHNTNNKCQQQQRHALLSQGHQEGRWKTSRLSPKVINPLIKQNGMLKPQNETVNECFRSSLKTEHISAYQVSDNYSTFSGGAERQRHPSHQVLSQKQPFYGIFGKKK